MVWFTETEKKGKTKKGDGDGMVYPPPLPEKTQIKVTKQKRGDVILEHQNVQLGRKVEQGKARQGTRNKRKADTLSRMAGEEYLLLRWRWTDDEAERGQSNRKMSGV